MRNDGQMWESVKTYVCKLSNVAKIIKKYWEKNKIILAQVELNPLIGLIPGITQPKFRVPNIRHSGPENLKSPGQKNS